MSVSHDQESHASPSGRQESSPSLSAEERQLFNELLHVLKRLASAKGLSDANDAEISTNAKADKIEDEKAAARNDHETVENERRQEHNEIKSFVHFRKLCDDHGQLAYRIQTSLNTLGGGGRTAKALQGMHEAVEGIRDLFDEDFNKTVEFRLNSVESAYGGYKEATLEAIDAFKELGVFNVNFFDAIEKIVKQLETMTAKFNVEYSCRSPIVMDMYLDSMFEPLIKDFESFLVELTNVAEKEIATIRQSQNFISQRYLNLTTVATFLSSVTATTLQTTTDDSDSSLWSAINTLWFISLDFSMASAVFSLLVMTWRQSSVCKPDLSLPPTLKTWFLNGPMYTLIASVLAFSIGLSLFAFRALRQQVGLASAVVPSTLAGILASSIFLFSAWFLFEQWKARHNEGWDMVRNKYLIPITKVLEMAVVIARNCGRWIRKCAKGTALAFKAVRLSTRGRRKSEPSSLFDEKVGANLEAALAQVPLEESQFQEVPPPQVHMAENVSNPQSETASPEITLAIPDTTPTAQQGDSETNDVFDNESAVKEVEYELFQDVLRFSPEGRFLASAHSDTIVIYDVRNSYSIFSTIKDPEASQIKQIAWNPDFYFRPPDEGRLDGELLVRSSKGISIWNIRNSPPNAYQVGHLKGVTGAVRWTRPHDAGIIGFINTTKCSIRLFDEQCKEDLTRSIDVSKLPELPDTSKVEHVIDAIFFQSKYIFCLVHLAGSPYDALLVINLETKKVESHRGMYEGHKRMIFSLAAKRILFIGNEIGVEVAELSILSSEDGLNVSVSVRTVYRLWLYTIAGNELRRPERAVTFHGNDDRMIIGYSSGEIVALYKPKADSDFDALHIFSTQTKDAIPTNPVGFSVFPWGWSGLYLFAFADKYGSVTIWSIQSNEDLSNCKIAKVFAVEDRRDGRWVKSVNSRGKYLVLPPPTVHDSAGQSSQEAH